MPLHHSSNGGGIKKEKKVGTAAFEERK